MLFGEHAVLHGHRAVVAAVHKRMRVCLTPRSDLRISIRSDLGTFESELSELVLTPPFQFMLHLVLNRRERFPSGFDLEVTSEFSHTVGLGSSAAVTVATAAVLAAFCGESFNKKALHAEAVEGLRAIQGSASGSDAAASTYGGVLHVWPRHDTVTPVEAHPPVSLVYCGYKTPTPRVIARIEQARKRDPAYFSSVFAMMEHCGDKAVETLSARDWKQTGIWMNRAQGLMDAIGLSDRNLNRIIDQVRAVPTVDGAKISGSGLGDCVVVLGLLDQAPKGFEHLPVAIDAKGVTLE